VLVHFFVGRNAVNAIQYAYFINQIDYCIWLTKFWAQQWNSPKYSHSDVAKKQALYRSRLHEAVEELKSMGLTVTEIEALVENPHLLKTLLRLEKIDRLLGKMKREFV